MNKLITGKSIISLGSVRIGWTIEETPRLFLYSTSEGVRPLTRITDVLRFNLDRAIIPNNLPYQNSPNIVFSDGYDITTDQNVMFTIIKYLPEYSTWIKYLIDSLTALIDNYPKHAQLSFIDNSPTENDNENSHP